MILITGGCGYIGAHCAIDLINKNYEILIIDNLSNSNLSNLEAIQKITNVKVNFFEGDVRDINFLNKIFNENKIESVIHLAGLKSVSESFSDPIKYYSNNLEGTITLLEKIQKNKIKNLIFSSSATVYGNKHPIPWRENVELEVPLSPYAQTKYFVEKILENCVKKYDLNVGILRYFNPVGYHSSGIIGEKVSDQNNLLPSIVNYLIGNSAHLNVYGNDYETRDGTGVRDYIHINDLVSGHLSALEYIKSNKGYHIWNLGRGEGYSVLEIIDIFEEVSKRKIKYSFKPRRQGDLSSYWCDPQKAIDQLNWKAKKNVYEMVRDSMPYIENQSKKTN
tara:strand:- start:15 stop:1019 length:1005 start_codon:yes stop_codon:yes gene_type:complete